MTQEAKCPHYQDCGGCNLQHVIYKEQIAKKSDHLKDELKTLTTFDDSEGLERIESPPFEYRNRIRLKIKNGRKGFCAKRSNDFVPINYCHLLSESANTKLRTIENHLKDKFFKDIREIEFFFTEKGFCYSTFFTGKRKLNRKNLNSIHQKIGMNNLSITLKNNSESIHSGNPWIQTKVGNYNFEFTPLSFFQTNRFILEPLLEKYASFIEKQAPLKAIDLFCGVGFLSLPLTVKNIEVYGFEANQESIMAAKRNSQINSVEGLCHFKVKNLNGKLDEIDEINPELIVVDPPRSGMHKQLRIQISNSNSIQSIIYLSCNPKTLARDLRDFCDEGFRIKKTVLVDMFPQTNHIESLVYLFRG